MSDNGRIPAKRGPKGGWRKKKGRLNCETQPFCFPVFVCEDGQCQVTKACLPTDLPPDARPAVPPAPSPPGPG